MNEFLEELGYMLDYYEDNSIQMFESDFHDLVHRYRMVDDVLDIANIVAHNYNCHHHGRKDALIYNLEQYKSQKQGEYY